MEKTSKQPERLVSPNHKCSLILRLWREERPGAHDWRASVEVPEAGKRIGFASLEQLFAFLIDFSENDCDMGKIEDKEQEFLNGKQC